MAVKQVFNTSAELDFPNVLPTLDLDFANSKTLDPRITFTRASGGSYVGADGLIKYAGVNEARFDHDPVTGESLGLLVEESRTNLLLRSEEFNIIWGKAFSNLIPNQATSPNGTFTADKFIPDDTFNRHYAQQTLTITANATYTFSCFAKAAELNFASVIFGMGSSPFTRVGIIINLTTGEVSNYTVGTPLSVVRHPVQYYGNGWWKISVSVLIDTTTTLGYVEVGASSLSTNYSGYRGDNASGIYIWGAQLEQGSFPTSYIPTQASTRTRAADNASITGKNFSDFYKQIGYTIFSEHITSRPSSVYPRVFNISTSTDGFRLNHYQPPQANYVGFSAVQNNITFGDITYFNITQSVKAKMATSYDFNNVVLYVNGDFVGRDITNPYPSQNRDRINIGSATPSGSYINSTISKITYYPYPLKDSNLQSLTS